MFELAKRIITDQNTKHRDPFQKVIGLRRGKKVNENMFSKV